MDSDDTFVIGLVGEKIMYIRSFHYATEKQEAEKVLEYVQKQPFTGWYISHVGLWSLSHKNDPDTKDKEIDVPFPSI